MSVKENSRKNKILQRLYNKRIILNSSGGEKKIKLQKILTGF